MDTPASKKIQPIHIRIKQFQSIEDIEFEVHGFTCITGPTNIGKSALVRAMFGALTNSPVTGDVRKGARYCTVEMKSDGWSIKWEKGEGISKYWLNGADKPLSNVGQGQIEQVMAMGFQPIKLGRDDRTYPWAANDQHKTIFLLDESGPSVTDFLSEVSSLKLLQDSIVMNVRQRRKDLDEVKVREKDAARLLSEEARYGSLDNVLGLKQELEEQLDSIEKYWQSIAQLNELRSDIISIQVSLDMLMEVSKYRRPRAPKPESIQQISILKQLNVDMRTAALAIRKYRTSKDVKLPSPSQYSDIADKIKKLNQMIPIRARLEEARKSILKLKTDIQIPEAPDLPKNLARAIELSEQLSLSKINIKELESELFASQTALEEVTRERDSIPVCPSCHRPLNVSASPKNSNHRHA
ncbi:MAG TPA: hypothetical protein VIE65_00430 [Methylobacter sp.]